MDGQESGEGTPTDGIPLALEVEDQSDLENGSSVESENHNQVDKTK